MHLQVCHNYGTCVFVGCKTRRTSSRLGRDGARQSSEAVKGRAGGRGVFSFYRNLWHHMFVETKPCRIRNPNIPQAGRCRAARMAERQGWQGRAGGGADGSVRPGNNFPFYFRGNQGHNIVDGFSEDRTKNENRTS